MDKIAANYWAEESELLESLMHQVLVNLCVNAMQSIPLCR